MGTSWSGPPSRGPSPAAPIILAAVVIVSAWMVLMVGLARGMVAEGPEYVPNVELTNEREIKP